MAKKIPLLEKFEIEIEKLDYSYIDHCENATELEKIYMILVSNEEGYYPDLTEAAKRRLEKVKPNARCLRTEQKLLKKDHVDSEMQEEINIDIQEFLKSLQKTERGREKMQLEMPRIPIRSENTIENVPINQNKPKECTSAMIEEITVHGLTENQLRELESFHRNKGNSFYKAKEFNEALSEYSKCLETLPNPHAYNNRAITYMKLKRYDEALDDLQECLSLDCHNTKAMLRKADIYLKIHKKHEALGIFEEIQLRNTNCGDFVKEQIDKLKRDLNVRETTEKRNIESMDKSTYLEDDFAKLIIPKNILPSKSKKLVDTFKDIKEMNKSNRRAKEPIVQPPSRLIIEEI